MNNNIGRGTFTFVYTNEELLEAVKSKHSYHTDKLSWWKAEDERRRIDIKENGLEFSETINPGKLSNNTSYYNEDVTIDPEKKKKRNESKERVGTHSEAVADFARWIRAFEHETATEGGNLIQELTIDDIEYFGL